VYPKMPSTIGSTLADRRRINAIGASDVGIQLALSKPLERFLALVRGKLRRTAEFYTTRAQGLGGHCYATRSSNTNADNR
jgi:hypothetical protein